MIIYQKAFGVAMEIFQLTKSFPKEETYSLVDQMRRSSRSVAANLSEAFRKRHYPKLFVSKIVDCESEAAETQVWIDFAKECHYIDQSTSQKHTEQYDEILRMAIGMKLHPEDWLP